MSHYVIIDGVLQMGTPESKRWSRRAAQAIPLDTEEKPDAVALPTEDKRTLAEVIEGLDEIPES
jgi:hypothetical protein